MKGDLVQRVATEGVQRLPPEDLLAAAAQARDWGVATADARYLILSDSLSMIARWFDEYDGALSTVFLNRIDGLICAELPHVLNVADAEVACALAAALHDSLVGEALAEGDLRRPAEPFQPSSSPTTDLG